MHVPEGWSLAKLEDISEIRSGATPLRSKAERYFSNDGIPWVKTLDLNNAKIEDTEEKITELAIQETSCSIFPKDTVLVAMYGGFNQIGRTGVLGIPASINQALSALIIDASKALSLYVLYYLNGNVKRWRQFAASSRKDPNITQSDVKRFPILLPSLAEQEKIAEILSTWDQTIEQTERLKANAEMHKKALMQQLLTGKKRLLDENGERFSEEWKFGVFSELFRVISKRGLQIKQADYLKEGSIPIVDQGQDFIAGYSNKIECFSDIPVIVFGDHTRILKWVDFRFIPGADGTQLLKTTDKLDIKFAYYLLQNTHIPNLGYSRHMRILKEIDFKYSVSILEQQKIASVLNTADREIELLTKKIEHLKSEKRALMQQLLTGKRQVKVDG